MLKYILISYATMLLFIGIPVQINNTELQRSDAIIVAVAPITFPLTILAMGKIAVIGNLVEK